MINIGREKKKNLNTVRKNNKTRCLSSFVYLLNVLVRTPLVKMKEILYEAKSNGNIGG